VFVYKAVSSKVTTVAMVFLEIKEEGQPALCAGCPFVFLFLILGKDFHHSGATHRAFAFNGIGTVLEHGFLGIFDELFALAFQAIRLVFLVSHGGYLLSEGLLNLTSG